MSVAEELRKHADLAIKEGGMYYSGEYLDAIARRVESEQAENAKLRELVDQMYRDMQGVLDESADTVWVDSIGTLRDKMDCHMQDMAELGMPPMDYKDRMRELGRWSDERKRVPCA